MAAAADEIWEGDDGAPKTDADCWRIDPAPLALAALPVEFIAAEHQRQRMAASILTRLADGDFDTDGVMRLIDFLETDIPAQTDIETRAFYIALTEHCKPEDDIWKIVDRLVRNQKDDAAACKQALVVLRRRLANALFPADDARVLRNCADRIRRRLAMEDAVLLPIARVRLDAAAQLPIGEAIARSRRL